MKDAFPVRLYKNAKRAVFYHSIRLFREPGASEHVARGFAVGLGLSFVPTFGFGPAVSGFAARICGGSTIAGVLGGISLMAFWPILFYLNIKVGGLFFKPPMLVEDLEDITGKAVDTLLWGKTFVAGACVNMLCAGMIAYLCLLAIHSKFRAPILAYFRYHAREYRREDWGE